MIQSQLRFDDFFEGENAPPPTHPYMQAIKRKYAGNNYPSENSSLIYMFIYVCV